jgi:hypothetical protein
MKDYRELGRFDNANLPLLASPFEREMVTKPSQASIEEGEKMWKEVMEEEKTKKPNKAQNGANLSFKPKYSVLKEPNFTSMLEDIGIDESLYGGFANRLKNTQLNSNKNQSQLADIGNEIELPFGNPLKEPKFRSMLGVDIDENKYGVLDGVDEFGNLKGRKISQLADITQEGATGSTQPDVINPLKKIDQATNGQKLMNAAMIGQLGVGAATLIGSLFPKNNAGFIPQKTNPLLINLANEAYAKRNVGLSAEENAKLAQQQQIALNTALQQARNTNKSLGVYGAQVGNIAGKAADAKVNQAMLNQKAMQQARGEAVRLQSEIDRLERADIESLNAIKKQEIQNRMNSAKQRMQAVTLMIQGLQTAGESKLRQSRFAELQKDNELYRENARNIFGI